MVYRWKPVAGGIVSKGVSAQAVGEALEELQSGGRLTSARVVEAAKNRRSPLHRLFEWDDTKAAHGYRMGQAATIMSALVKVVVAPGREAKEEVRAFVSIKNEEDSRPTAPGFFVANTAARAPRTVDPSERAWDELLEWRKRHGHLPEFLRVCMAIDICLKQGKKESVA
jgi:hypothetical protein